LLIIISVYEWAQFGHSVHSVHIVSTGGSSFNNFTDYLAHIVTRRGISFLRIQEVLYLSSHLII
jgi:hypothetical protein